VLFTEELTPANRRLHLHILFTNASLASNPLLCGDTGDPAQVFTLLESVYSSFDKISISLGVFKVETVGDCYGTLSLMHTVIEKDSVEHQVLTKLSLVRHSGMRWVAATAAGSCSCHGRVRYSLPERNDESGT